MTCQVLVISALFIIHVVYWLICDPKTLIYIYIYPENFELGIDRCAVSIELVLKGMRDFWRYRLIYITSQVTLSITCININEAGGSTKYWKNPTQLYFLKNSPCYNRKRSFYQIAAYHASTSNWHVSSN